MAFYAVTRISHGTPDGKRYEVEAGGKVDETKFTRDELRALQDAGVLTDSEVPTGAPREIELQAQIDQLQANLEAKEKELEEARNDLDELRERNREEESVVPKASVPKPAPQQVAPKKEGPG
jgi:chromosome segregation ATPase